MLSKFSCRWTLAQYQAEKRQEKVWRNKIIITALASAFAPGFLEQHLMKIIFFIQEMLLSLKTSWSAALNPVPDMFLVGWCSRPCFSPKRINLSLEIWISNNLKVHNTYYNNMVCYINNKQSDTDSHQSKVESIIEHWTRGTHVKIKLENNSPPRRTEFHFFSGCFSH